ncbi:MAG: hypothetical protein HOG49_24875 [Candidatus Scalindua sp.]|jgi:hypothetical protein|nr:hypothetical protein [Candidatus Scalindua sp.]
MQDEEIPKHKRKKGKKPFRIEERLTEKGAQRRRDKEEERIQKDMKWSDGYTKYETLKHAQQALEDIERKKKGAQHVASHQQYFSWYSYSLVDHEHRIKEV